MDLLVKLFLFDRNQYKVIILYFSLSNKTISVEVFLEFSIHLFEINSLLCTIPNVKSSNLICETDYLKFKNLLLFSF